MAFEPACALSITTMSRDRYNSRGDRGDRGDRNDRGGRGGGRDRDRGGYGARRDRDYGGPEIPAPPMKDLVEFIAKGMVDDAEAVSVNESVDRSTIFVELRVAQGEVGRVIGREGKLANAIRTLLRVAGNRARKRVVLDIGD